MTKREEKLRRIQELERERAALMRDIEVDEVNPADEGWPPKTFYWWYHITTGSILGGVGAIVSLFFNVIGSVLFDKHPFELIKVFMTFPMGGAALTSDSDVTLVIGIILYIVTGTFYGIIFEVLMYRFFPSPRVRSVLALLSLLGLRSGSLIFTAFFPGFSRCFSEGIGSLR